MLQKLYRYEWGERNNFKTQFVPFYRRLDKEFLQFESEGTEQGTQTSCVYLLVYH